MSPKKPEGVSPFELNRAVLESTAPSLRYNDGDFNEWQKKAYNKLEELLGLPLKKCNAEFVVEYERDTEKYHEIRFSFQSEEGYRVPGHFLSPAGADTPLPVIICLQGHSTGMHNSLGIEKYEGEHEQQRKNDRAFALLAIERGLCAVCIEQRCFGECGGKPTEENGWKTKPDCYLPSMVALLSGRTTVGERVWDISRLIDVLELHFPQADSSKIYCMGNSGGGTATFYAACIDKRISACMPSCALCTFAKSIGAMHHCACNYIPGIAKYFDMGDIAGLIAPRKIVVVSGEQDSIFSLDGAKDTYAQLSHMYALAGAAENCKWVVGNQGHRFYSDLAWPVFLELTNSK